MKQFIYLLKAILLSVFFTLAVSCKGTGGGTEEEGAFDVQISVPKTIEIPSDNPQATFKVLFGKAPLKTDIMSFKDASGRKIETPIVSVSEKNVVVNCQNIVASGDYTVVVSRSSKELELGRTSVILDDGVKPSEGSNIYGLVSVDGKGLADVVVSDGVEVVRTDSDGKYSFKSAKKYGYVFLSTPSGYMPQVQDVLPLIYRKVARGNETKVERVDFPLLSEGNQTNHKMLVFGDMHLAGGRNNDGTWFSRFCNDVNEYVNAHPGEKIYAITLGDMTWDYYWYDKNYVFDEYLADIKKIVNVPIFHTVGNHDHDMNEAGDFDTILRYMDTVAPDYYSFNIGNVHYVILDNILCTNNGGGKAYRTYEHKVSDDQMKWLEKDLSFVSKSTPVVIAMHAPVSNLAAGNRTSLLNIVSSFDQVHFFTGHSHQTANNTGSNWYDHNCGAVCADWWDCVKETSGKVHIGTDGSFGGYEIFDIKNTDFSWVFKGTERDQNVQFRTYDRNNIHLTAEKCTPSNFSDKAKEIFNTVAGDWTVADKNNEVYINVFNYDSKWKIEVTENGKPLTVEKSGGSKFRDPLHILIYMSVCKKEKEDAFTTKSNGHMWKVTASSPNSTLEIKVTDRFGNVYTETMTRPKAFNVDTYAK